MTEPALRLVEDDGTHYEIARQQEIVAELRREIGGLKRILNAATEELNIERETVKKYARENAQLKARIIRQVEQDAQDELINAIFEFWRKMTHHPRAQCGSDKIKAINKRVREGATPRDFFKAIVGAAYDSFVDEKGKRHDGLVLICERSEKFEARVDRFYRVPDVRQLVEECEAIDEARRLMDLERARAPKESTDG